MVQFFETHRSCLPKIDVARKVTRAVCQNTLLVAVPLGVHSSLKHNYLAVASGSRYDLPVTKGLVIHTLDTR